MADEKNSVQRNPSHSSFWRWLAFSVAFGTIPLLATWAISALLKQPFSLLEVLSHGELLIVSIAIVLEALRDLQYINQGNGAGFKTAITWAGVGVIVGTCLYFAVIAANDVSVASSIGTLLNAKDGQEAMTSLNTLRSGENAIDKSLIVWVSVIMFILACFTGGSCKWVEKSSSKEKPLVRLEVGAQDV